MCRLSQKPQNLQDKKLGQKVYLIFIRQLLGTFLAPINV